MLPKSSLTWMVNSKSPAKVWGLPETPRAGQGVEESIAGGSMPLTMANV